MTASPNILPYVRDRNFFSLSKKFSQSPLTFLSANTAKYGDTFRAKLFLRDLTVTSHPEWMRYILQTHHKDFGRGYAYQILRMALGNGLLVNEGESWMQQRRLAQPAFYKKRLHDLFYVMEDKANDMMDRLDKERGRETRITDHFWKVTSDIVIATLLGGGGFTDGKHLQEAILEIQEYLVDRIRQPARIPLLYLNGRHARFRKILAEFDEGIYKILQKRRSEGSSGSDLVSLLMDAEDADTGLRMDDRQLRDEFLTIYVAGHETSSYALSWTLFLLGQHPEAYRKAKEEARSIVHIDHIGFEGLRSLPYIEQVLMESMRLYPPAWIAGRKVLADHTIGNTQIKEGDAILLNIYGLHRDARYWPEPNRFRPERFSTEEQKKRDKFSYVPFGAGPRMCIGNQFATMEITMLLAKLLYHFDFELIRPENVEPEPLITLRPRDGILVKLT